MIGAETSYTSSRRFFDMEKTGAGQDDSVLRLDQGRCEVVVGDGALICLGNTRGKGANQGWGSTHVNSFSMVYRRIAGCFE
jgi:hypothetical protein